MGRALLAAAVTSALLVIARVVESVSLPFLRCLFREASGLPCPFCGGMRTLAALSHGHPVAALAANPLVCAAAAAGITAPLVVFGARVLAARAGRDAHTVLARVGTRAATRVLLALLAVQWIYLVARVLRP